MTRRQSRTYIIVILLAITLLRRVLGLEWPTWFIFVYGGFFLIYGVDLLIHPAATSRFELMTTRALGALMVVVATYVLYVRFSQFAQE